MPLPQLNTSGIDVGNALLKIRGLEQQDAALARQAEQDKVNNVLRAYQIKNIESEIADREAGRPAKNALAILQQKETAAKLKTENIKDVVRGISWVKEHPDPINSYNTFRATVTDEYQKSNGTIGIHPAMLPDPDYFIKRTPDEITGGTAEWDKEKFNKFADNGLLAANMSLHPIEGKTWDIVVKTPASGIKDESGNIITPDVSKYAKVHMGVKDGKIVAFGAGVAEDIEGKEQRAERAVAASEKRLQLLEDKASKGEKLSMTDIKSAYGMDVAGIKNRMLIDMTPEEQQSFSGQSSENILAMLLAGKGKSLSPEKKKSYIKELQDTETYYGKLQDQVLGRKGVKTPKEEKPAAAVAPATPGGVKAQSDGKNVTMNGKSYPIAADGTVEIDGQKYKVQ